MIEDTFPVVKMTLAQLSKHVQNFLAANAHKSKETCGTYERALKEFVHFFALDRKFFFRVRDVERYRVHLAERKKMQNASIATYMTALRRLCQFLVDAGVLEKNAAKRVQGGQRPTAHNRTFLSLEEIDQLLNSIDLQTPVGLRDYAIIRTMLGCACSEVELMHADVGDLRQHGKKWFLYVQGKGKSVKDEMIPVPVATVKALHTYLGTRTASGHYAADSTTESSLPADAPLFTSYSNRSMHQRITIRGLREAIVLRLKGSGVKGERHGKLTPFSLRHTAGILLVEQGATPEELMHRMRIEWRPTAMLYFKQKGKLHSVQHKGASTLLALEEGAA